MEETSVAETTPFGKMTLKKKIRYILENITLEPACILFGLNFGFLHVASDQIYIDKLCQVNLNHSAEICENIYNHTEIQLVNQENVTRLRTISSVIQAIPPLVYALFAGPWSDKHGRKWLIFASMFGHFLSNSVFLVNAIWFHELKAEYLLFECIQGIKALC